VAEVVTRDGPQCLGWRAWSKALPAVVLRQSAALFSPVPPYPGRPAPAASLRFNDLKAIDKIANVQSKVDAVTGVMQKNIEQALKNTDRIEDIDEKAVVLADSALKFKNAGGSLKRNMRCRYYKMIALFSLLIIAVLVIIIVPLVINKQKEEEASGGR
jgi:hypothetical protein